MALIKCPECGAQISDAAKQCVHCGCIFKVCPECGKTMFKKSGRGFNKPFCINEECSKFVPEDKRGYKRKTAAKTDSSTETDESKSEKPAAKRGRRKTAAQ